MWRETKKNTIEILPCVSVGILVLLYVSRQRGVVVDDVAKVGGLYVSIRQHTSEYVSIRAAYVRIRQHTCSIRQHTCSIRAAYLRSLVDNDARMLTYADVFCTYADVC